MLLLQLPQDWQMALHVAAPQQEAPKQEEPAASAPSGSEDGAGYVTPLVRKLATEHGVDLSSLQGTGVGGRIRKQDVLDAAGGQGGGQESAPAGESADTAATGRAEIPQPAQGTAAAAPAYVDQAVKAAPDTTVRGKTEQMSRLRKVIAQRMTCLLYTSPSPRDS